MAKDLEIGIDLKVNKLDDGDIKNEANKAGKEIGDNLNEGMVSSVAKGQAIWDTIKGSLRQVWEMTKQFFNDSINLAKSYESAFAGVRKTVDGTESDFKRLDSQLKKMAKTIPIQYEELAKVMELGGQLGVSIENLDKFTEVVSELGVATNLTSESAAQMLAQFANITKMDLNDIDKLGAVIVDLGNNFATTESDIVNFAQRIAGAGQIAGISQANIMAISTAFASVGIEAEAGGTAVQKVLLDINGAINTGGERLQQYANILGLTVGEFKELYNTNPEKIFEGFVKGLGKAGDKAQVLLDELGLSDQRLTRGFLSLAQNSDILTEAINRSNIAWEENVALVNEAEQRFQTTESQMIMLQNERANLMAEIGEKLKGTALLWEEIKTAVLESMAGLMGISPNTTSLIDNLKGKTVELDKEIQNLKADLLSGKITLDEYMESVGKLEDKKADLNKQIEENQKKVDDLTKSIKYEKAQIEIQREEYERLNKKFGENSSYTKAQKEFLEELIKTELKHEQELEAIMNPIEENTEAVSSLANATGELKVANDNVLEAEKAFNEYKIDGAKTRAEFDKNKAKAIELAETYMETLRIQQAILGQQVSNGWKTGSPKVGDILALGETTKKVIELQKRIESLKKTVYTGKGGGSGGGGSSKNREKTKKEELQALRDLELQAIMDSELDEEAKYKKYIEIYDKYKDKIIEAEGKTYDELYKKAEDYLDEKEKNIKKEIDYYDDLLQYQDKVNDSIEDHKKNVEALGDEWTNVKKKASDSIREINNQLKELDEDYSSDIGERFVKVEDSIKEFQRKYGNVEWLEGYSVDMLKNWDSDEISGIKVDDAIKYLQLLEEEKWLNDNITDQIKKQAEEKNNLTEAQKIENEYQEKKNSLLERRKILEAVSNSGNRDEEAKVRYKDLNKETVEYFDEEEQQWKDITDFKNEEYAREVLDNQEKLQQKKTDLDNALQDELKAYGDQVIKIKNEYSKDTKNYTDELDKKKKAFAQYVKEMNELASQLSSKVSHNAYGGSVLNGRASRVGENGPEQIIARQSSYVQPRNAVQNNSTVYNNQSSLNINGIEVGNFNTIDDLLNELKNRLTYRN